MSERFGTGSSLENSLLLLGMNGFRPESHVAQQSRRDKLRVQQLNVGPPPPAQTAAAAPHHHNLVDGDLPCKSDSHHLDLVQVRDVDRSCCDGSLYDPAAMFSAPVLDFSSAAAATVAHVPHQNPGLWRATVGGSQPNGGSSSEWLMNYVPIQNPYSLASQFYPKPGGFSFCHDMQPTVNDTNNSSCELSSQRELPLPFGSPPFYHNAFQDVVTSSSSNVASHQQGLEMAAAIAPAILPPDLRDAGGRWEEGGNELALLPSYANQRNTLAWHGAEDGGFGAVPVENAAKGLSLSLSSNYPPPPDLCVTEFDAGIAPSLPDSRGTDVAAHVSSSSKFPVHGVSSSVDARRCLGPLGPFTGYATILKNSRFLKPAQMLLDEFCRVVTGPKQLTRRSETSDMSSTDVSTTCSTAVVADSDAVLMRAGSSGGSSASLYSSSDQANGGGGDNSGSIQVHCPEFQQKKAKLLYMQEEVCRRYKQYHQQMQMVVSSFESVAGLSAATPYTSLALKAVSKHFRCLKNAISEQLRHISRVLGEDFMMFSPGSSKGETVTTPRLKFMDQTFRKQKAGESGLGFMDHNQPIWRPQRGLPERAVAVLRAWLFEHFLHPYPTDSDKHMLASQTGLSRNQVSNWFINARVRLWKPMVEEIHMLETKGLAEMDLNSSKSEGKPAAAACGGSSRGPTSDSCRLWDYQSGKSSECSYSVGPTSDNVEDCHPAIEQWHREKRSKMMEHCSSVSASMNGGLMGFSTYQGGGIDLGGGLGSVSLTLGLRHNEGSAHQQQQQMRHFGTQLIHDFVG